MASAHTFILSDIPGFFSCVTTSTVDPTIDKYYSIIPYSTKANQNYGIIRYKKDFLASDLVPIYGLLRSIILSNDRVVAFAPPKSISPDNFINKYPFENTSNPNIVAEEFVEGTMINLFFDYSAKQWQIATRSTVGAEISFYQKKSFHSMFFEACQANQFYIDTLNPDFCYSFVLQHPENRIVVPFSRPQLYLIAVYKIIQTDNTIVVQEQNMVDVRMGGMWALSGIKFPEQYVFSKYSELIERFASANTPYDTMGVIIKNIETGERTKIRNPIYEEVRHLRGNQPKLQYQYLSLRHSGKLSEFLKYYPETKPEMSKFRDQVHLFTNTLHQNYISCYVKKERPLREYPEQYRTHMFKIHEIFLTDLREKKLFVTNTIVMRYVNALHPSLLMYCLNFNMRKRHIDTIRADMNISE